MDKLVVSHGDNDHIGGAGAIQRQFPIIAIYTSVPERFTHAALCERGQAWDWDGVHFEFLYPTRDMLHQDNDSSCVLRVSNTAHSILLTGDIERAAEQHLLAQDRDRLAVDILVAPHHGVRHPG